MIPHDAPFVLIDDQGAGGRQTLFRDPVAIITVHRSDEIGPALQRIRAETRGGRHAAGWIGYAAGNAFEPRAAASEADPLLWFGIFDRAIALPPDALDQMLPDPAGAWIGPPKIEPDRAAYEAAFARVQAYIAAGDIYQANLSVRGRAALLGDPRAAYRRLRMAAQARWGALIHDGARWILSCSPELFVRTDGRRVLTRPMKGTAPRGRTPAEDDAYAAALAGDPKERAENLMIVDLLRNDLSRVAVAGSVRVPSLFAVERYPTILQMTSDVAATLAPGRDAIDLVEALFPCGSITGAPKVRAMQVIEEVETGPRNLYTGAIGMFAPDGAASLNVAIRTLAMPAGSQEAKFGLGSAVVADSTAEREWRECLAKSAFVTAGQRPIGLIETMRFEPGRGIVDRDRHLARMQGSADLLGLPFDPSRIVAALNAHLAAVTEGRRVRLHLSFGGAIEVGSTALPPPPSGEVDVRIVALPVDPSDFRLAHKTDDRLFYDDARKAAGTFEVAFARRDGLLTEGSFTNLFVRRDSLLLTPPAARGLLPGILRARLLEQGEAIEADLTADDLRDGFYVGNAVRGLLPARLA
ncbi:aminodeoxychorismate synthase component I [Sphingomonas nostoxanthinifaciens]|uniref:aminodeoxychorismate synthase component I n=1 Tax=Sphingomonas nostoxanthinifaciens TaxID=2872652 RepID=UPI001CC2054B|nr:aminodeoxychorismate synthase component I [Sphingomonas nostoxanthinifaciens]UAK23024.1 aminodeoxychorismate synthase component I [Sphingomonas nostoxanthinifaciens]